MKSRAVPRRARQGRWKLAIAVGLAMPSPGFPEALAPRLTAQTDSAGVPITTARAPLWGPGEGWTVSDEPLVRIGALAGAPEQQLNGVVGTVRLSGGDIVIGEWTTGELRRYGGDGNLVWRAAGEGEGPGEHAFLAFVGRLPGDSLVTFDQSLLRAQVFAPGGEAVRTMRVEWPGSGFGPGDAPGTQSPAVGWRSLTPSAFQCVRSRSTTFQPPGCSGGKSRPARLPARMWRPWSR